MKLKAFTSLAFLMNFIIGNQPADLSQSEVRAAARKGRLLTLLATRYDHLAEVFNLVYDPGFLQELEADLSDAARILLWGESRRIGVSRSGLCLAMAIVLEALQQSFIQPLLLSSSSSQKPNQSAL